MGKEIGNFFTKFEETIKIIDSKIRFENFQDLDVTQSNISNLRTLLTTCNKIVSVNIISS